MQLFRISVKMKETDKRKNAVVWRYVVMAETLETAKTLATAERVGRVDSPLYRLSDIASVGGHAMGTLAYGCDNYGEKDKTERPETVPTLDEVRLARQVLDAFEKAHETV
jgi:hypothetical protein